MRPGLPLPCVITAYADKSFTFIIKTPPTTVLIKKAAGIESGSARPHTDKVGKITKKQVKEVQGEDARPQRVRSGRGDAHRGGQRPLDGRDRGGHVNARFRAQEGVRQQGQPRQVLAALEAMKLVKETATAKFDEAVDVAMNLGIDAERVDRLPRVGQVLPAGTGKKVRLAVFASGDKAAAAKAAGADLVGMEDLAEQVKAGKIDFDVVIAAPEDDARGRRAQPDPRPARPDAQPEGRHRHPRTSQAR